jgi:hypothetical protein
VPKSYYVPYKKNFGPRLGFVYRPRNNMVVRGGWGIYYDYLPGLDWSIRKHVQPPWQLGATFATQLPGNPNAPFLPDLINRSLSFSSVVASIPLYRERQNR